jgi:hypothetical protein
MTGLSVLRHVYSLMEQPGRLTTAEGTESGLLALNQIYSDLWQREHSEDFVPLEHLRQELQLSWRCLPALTYGVAALLCLNGVEEKPYDRYLELYMRALPRVTGQPYRRSDVLFGEVTV